MARDRLPPLKGPEDLPLYAIVSLAFSLPAIVAQWFWLDYTSKNLRLSASGMPRADPSSLVVLGAWIAMPFALVGAVFAFLSFFAERPTWRLLAVAAAVFAVLLNGIVI